MNRQPDSMTARPAFFAEPETDATRADVLSQVLTLIRLRGERIYRTETKRAWRAQVPAGASHVHFVESGQLRIEPADASAQIARAGDLVLLPHGRGHALASDGTGTPTCFVGAIFHYEALPLPPILASLPSVVVIRGDDGPVLAWLRGAMQYLLLEAADPRPGSTLMISRMIDLLVIRTLRTWSEVDPRPSAALHDDRVAKALRAIHEQPERPWTLGGLAERAGMSRSAFAEHFSKVVGDSPLRYLAGWRLALADELLRSGGVGVAEVAHRVGYLSEPGFSRAFKARYGHAPNDAKPGASQRTTARRSDQASLSPDARK